MLNSVWSIPGKGMPSFPCLDSDAKTGVLIIGGGLAGLLTAYTMEQAGIDYLLIEADTICSGVSRNTTAKITSQHGLIYDKLIRFFGTETARAYWQANEAALETYRSLCREIHCDFETKDAYLYSVNEREKLEREMAALDRLGIPWEYADSLPLPFAVSGTIKFGCQGQFHPLKFAACIARGLNIREHTAAVSVEKNAVVTNRGRIRADKIVIATHFPIVNKHGFYFMKMYQERSCVLALENAPELNGMYRDAAENGLSFRNYGAYLLLGGEAHRTGKGGGGWSALENKANRLFPGATKRFYWATQDCMTLDGVPYIGQYGKNTPNLYVCTGFNKWGMTSSMVAAMILTKLVQGKASPWGEVFSPSRTILRPQLLNNMWESAAHLLTFSTPRCPHMGCALKWNRQERSWDCPCHGSRFTGGGTLLDNPATENLKNADK